MSLVRQPSPTPADGPADGSGSLSFFRRTEREQAQPVAGLVAGKVVGDFRLVSLLGQGGMGQVWEAAQVSLGNRAVAVKFVRPERVTAHQLELFAREARAGGRLSHPGIVGVHGYGESDGLAWIAMELVSGAWTLRDSLDEVSRMAEVPAGYDRHVARFAAEIAEALQTAHEAGVIHRDLKPQNILVTPSDRPKVTDFGLARITDESALSQTGDFAGTYLYMSPEQVTAKRMGIDHRSDVFSLGVVLYEMLALRRPFEGDTSHQIAEQIVTMDPPDPRSIRSKVPRDLAVIAGKALEKARARRYQTMAELAADLRRWLANEPIQATPPTRIDRAVKWVQRNPTKSAVTGLAGLALVAISALLMANVRTNRDLRVERTNLAQANTSLEAKTAEALENAEAAKRKAEEVLRLSALQELDDLLAEADRLWPTDPELVPRYKAWVDRARALVQDLSEHRAQRAELELLLDERRDGQFVEEEREARWWNNQLTKLIAGLEELEGGLLAEDAVSEAHGWSVSKRIAFAVAVAGRSVSGAEAGARWAEALLSIADRSECPAYGGLAIAPQMGLLPIGRDLESGLWEFAHLQTGEVAERGADRKLIVKEETGLVFVLLPGGTFAMGAQNGDPSGPNYDPQAGRDEGPVHEVTLSPFFLSKYEMTQGQWSRFLGRNPSYYQPPGGIAPSLLHPVEQVSWSACAGMLERLGLSLPSEAQWEYGARGGTRSAWWTGDEQVSLIGLANLADQAAARAGRTWPDINEWPELDDGYAMHAPVNEYAPNPFGLFNVHGNVWEWCLDGYDDDFGSSARVIRGGCFSTAAVYARSANRGGSTPEDTDDLLGLRPARIIAGSFTTSPLSQVGR